MSARAPDAVMLFGDSLTEWSWEYNGIGVRLSRPFLSYYDSLRLGEIELTYLRDLDVYARKLDVVNRGLGGFNTNQAISVFEEVFPRTHVHEQPHVGTVRLLAFWFGTNDAALPPNLQHVPLPQFTTNLKHLIKLIRSPSSEHYSPKTRILLISPPPINQYQLFGDPPESEVDREVSATKQYAEAAVRTAQEEGVAVADVWTACWEAAGKDERALGEYFTDGLHLNEKCYELAYGVVDQAIKQSYPETHHENLPIVIPQNFPSG